MRRFIKSKQRAATTFLDFLWFNIKWPNTHLHFSGLFGPRFTMITINHTCSTLCTLFPHVDFSRFWRFHTGGLIRIWEIWIRQFKCCSWTQTLYQANLKLVSCIVYHDLCHGLCALRTQLFSHRKKYTFKFLRRTESSSSVYEWRSTTAFYPPMCLCLVFFHFI